ncbi:serine protease [Streptomyces microflavus]|nr:MULTISPECIES: serine protease [Streptomyces]MDX2981648.1 serine protease [Streptomyces sp. NRRL_B-2249]GGX94949.1 hypothetical protein GCM10010298_70550 [Streptomyces microflavus]
MIAKDLRERFVIHENYHQNSGGASSKDIGVLKLKTPLSYTPRIQPVALPDLPELLGGPATLTGWGLATATGQPPNALQQATMTVMPVATCALRYRASTVGLLGNICTYTGYDGASACLGDSGGPLVQNGREIGIVSFSASNCSPRYPSVYTNVGFYRPWMNART